SFHSHLVQDLFELLLLRLEKWSGNHAQGHLNRRANDRTEQSAQNSGKSSITVGNAGAALSGHLLRSDRAAEEDPHAKPDAYYRYRGQDAKKHSAQESGLNEIQRPFGFLRRLFGLYFHFRFDRVSALKTKPGVIRQLGAAVFTKNHEF